MNAHPSPFPRAAEGPLLRVDHIVKSYEGLPLLAEVSFDIDPGQIVCLLGPSGTGKTTLLRVIAGLELPDSGSILYQGRDLAGVPAHRRNLGLMFQDLALFPHRSVFENVAFGLRVARAPLSEPEIASRVREMLALVGLDPARFASRDVNHLSGGEQQRVALARSLAPRPRFLMFDEPLGALDRILREQLIQEIRSLLKGIGMTALYVTHDQEEAFAIADQLVILHEGRVRQIGMPEEVYAHPVDAFVARFLGLNNLVPARVQGEGQASSRAVTPPGVFQLARPVSPGEGFVLIRPRALQSVTPAALRAQAHPPNEVHGKIVQAVLRGGHSMITVECESLRLVLEWEGPIEIGQPVLLGLNAEEISFLPARNKSAL